MQMLFVLRFIGVLSCVDLCSSLIVTRPEAVAPAAKSKVNSKVPVVPIPAKPTVKLPQPHGHRGGPAKKTTSASQVPVHCQRLDACFSEVKATDEAQSAAMFKSCIEKFCNDLHGVPKSNKSGSRASLCDEKGRQAWDVLSKAQAEVKLSSGHKASLVALRHQRPDVYDKVSHILFAESSTVFHLSSACQMEVGTPQTNSKVEVVPVPAKPTVSLPQPPNGHPGGIAAKTANTTNTPLHCQRLDACFSKIKTTNEAKSAVLFKSCIEDFCNALHAGRKLNKSDSRTALCDDKGKEAWEILSKAQAKIKVASGGKFSLVAFRSQQPNLYAKFLQIFFAKNSGSVDQSDVCVVGDVIGAPNSKTKPEAVSVPSKPSVDLPQPRGHPEGPPTTLKDQPTRCKKLDMCFSVFGESADGFKACIVRFCTKLSNESLRKPEHSDLCKDKGEKAWQVLAKAKSSSPTPGGRKISLMDVKIDYPSVYQEVSLVLFAQNVKHSRMADACRV